MAVWNADNVVLTKRGSEILSKVQSGTGAITVSRIVTGAGYVSASQLYNQTAVQNIKQEMTVVSESHDENGSTLNLRVTNDEVTAQYLMYQIGIYVTHPDYAGEQLYVISQVSDISHPDLIPAASEGVVTFNYSLYMEHANTSAVTVTVDPAGAVSMEDFLTHTNKAMCIERDEEPIEGTVLEYADTLGGKARAYFEGLVTAHANRVDNPHSVNIAQIGAAPSGYGYGDAIQLIYNGSTTDTESDFNLALEAQLQTLGDWKSKQVGFWTPPELNRGIGVFFGILYRLDSNWATITASTYNGCTLIKRKYNGVWLPGEWVNPQMAVGVEYRTTERVGSRIVYAKQIATGALTASSTKNIEHGLSNINAFCSIEGYDNNGNPLTVNAGVTRISMTSTNIVIATGSGYSTSNSWVVLKYTKTTD